jgi:chromosome segregation ATPase
VPAPATVALLDALPDDAANLIDGLLAQAGAAAFRMEARGVTAETARAFDGPQRKHMDLMEKLADAAHDRESRDALWRELAHLKEAYADIQRERDQFRQQAERAGFELADSAHDRESRDALWRELAHLKEAYADIQRERDQFRQQAERAGFELADSAHDRESRDALWRELAHLKEAYADIQRERDQFRQQAERAGFELADSVTTRDSFDRLQRKHVDLLGTLADTQFRRERLKNRVEQAEGELADAERERDAFGRLLERSVAKVVVLERERAELKHVIAEMAPAASIAVPPPRLVHGADESGCNPAILVLDGSKARAARSLPPCADRTVRKGAVSYRGVACVPTACLRTQWRWSSIG